MTLFFLHFENGWMDTEYNFFIVRSPSFYLVVGWLWGLSSSRRTIKEHWGKRIQGLVKPYLWFSLLFLLFDVSMVILNQFDTIIIWRDLYKTLCLRGIGTLWFLPALLGGELLFIYTRDFATKNKLWIYLIGYCILLSYDYWINNINITSNTIKDIINAPVRVLVDVVNAYIYISIAYWISRRIGKEIFNTSKSKQFFLGSFLLLIAFVILNFLLNIGTIPDLLLFIVGNVCAGIGILCLFKAIENYKFIEKPLSYCGRNSLAIMAVHFGILFQIALVINRTVLHNEHYSGFITVIYFLIATIMMIVITELINRKFKFIIGK